MNLQLIAYMDLQSSPIKNPSVLARKTVDGEMVLVNADSAASLALTNQTAITVWEMADGNNTIQDIIYELAHSYRGVPDTVCDDVLAFIDILSQDGFVGFELKDQS